MMKGSDRMNGLLSVIIPAYNEQEMIPKAAATIAVLYGDDVIIGEDPCIGQLIRAYEHTGMCGAVGIKEVSAQDIQKYSNLYF